jgi:hypothetical protein
MTDTRPTAPTAISGFLPSVLAYTAAQGSIVLAAAFIMQRFVWTDASMASSIQASAWLAVVVQTFSFAIARLASRQQVIAAWGMGVLVRFAVVAFWAFLGIKAFGLVPGPALLSLVVFFFVSTLIEPIFLNAS